MSYILKAIKYFVEALKHEDFNQVSLGVWVLDEYIKQHMKDFTKDELEMYFKIFDEFIEWDNAKWDEKLNDWYKEVR